jgi:hypothetical protein
MPVINNLTASNSSFVIQYGNYMDFNIWLLIVAISIGLMLFSRYISNKDEAGRFLLSVLAVLLAIAAIWGSLSLAHLDYTSGASIISNDSTINESITYNYVYPVQQVVASQGLTIICIILTIFVFLNALDIFITILQKPQEQDMKTKRGVGRI